MSTAARPTHTAFIFASLSVAMGKSVLKKPAVLKKPSAAPPPPAPSSEDDDFAEFEALIKKEAAEEARLWEEFMAECRAEVAEEERQKAELDALFK